MVKSGSDYWVLEDNCREFSLTSSRCIDTRSRLTRITPSGQVSPVLEEERNPWPGYSEWFRRIGAFDGGVMLLKATQSYDATTGTRNIGVLSQVNAHGQVSTFAENLPFASFGGGVAEYLSNLVQVGNSVALTRESFSVFRQNPAVQTCCGSELLQVDSSGQTSRLLDFDSFPVMKDFSLLRSSL
ncbi:MAG: hypothetical protein Q6L60_04360 [Thermostichus sp. HHBFW_bins_43]